MEKALFLQHSNTPVPAEFSRLYCGAEFCPWRFPSLGELQSVMGVARSLQLPLTVVTPVVAEFFLPRLRQVLNEFLPSLVEGDEVVISDWGTLSLLREIAPKLPVGVGRVLSGQKRGPQILDLELDETQGEYFRHSAWSSRETCSLLQELGISRVELDNPPQGLAPLPAGLAGVLHTPYAMVTSSRNCPFREGQGDHSCAARCGEVFTLSTPQSRIPLLQCGNTQFLRNDILPTDLGGLGIDRLVVHPALPR